MPSSSTHSHSKSNDEAGSTTSSSSKGRSFKLKRASNLLTTTGKPILALKDLVQDNQKVEGAGNDEELAHAEPQSLFRRQSSNLGRGMKSIRRKLKELKTGSSGDEVRGDVQKVEQNAGDDEQAMMDDGEDGQLRRSSSWLRRTSTNLSRSLSRSSTSTSTPSSFEVTNRRPGRHSRSASEALPTPSRPPLTLDRTTSSGSSKRRLSLNISKDRTGDHGYQSTALEDIVQSPTALSADSEHAESITPTAAVPSPPQLVLPISTKAVSSPPRMMLSTSTAAVPSPPQMVPSTSTDSAYYSAISPTSVRPFDVPPVLKYGTPLTKITAKKRQRIVVRVDWAQGQIVWESKPGVWKFIPIEAIREIRTGPSASFHLTQFNISQSYLPLWITIVYTASSSASSTGSPPATTAGGHLAAPPTTTSRGSPLLGAISLPSLNALSPKILSGPNGSSYSASTYKSLHLLCPSIEIFRIWEQTLKEMADVRVKLTDGLAFGMGDLNANREIEGMRQEMWERREFIGADTTPDSRLSFAEITKMCWKLNVRMSEDELRRLFISADSSHRGFLDFDDFKQFVKLLKARPELDRLYRKLIAKAAGKPKAKLKAKDREYEQEKEGLFTFDVFVDFMREKQDSTLPEPQLRTIFDRHSEPLSSITPAPNSPPPSLLPTPPAVAGLSQDKAFQLTLPTPPPSAGASPTVQNSDLPVKEEDPEEVRVMTSHSFASFLMGSDNPALLEPVAEDEGFGGLGLSRHLHLPHLPHLHLPHPHLHLPHLGHGHHSQPSSPIGGAEEKQPQPLSLVSHDMTRPMSEYFISSSHNTYLVGHQLVGVSTVEGYVRALIGGCRSVEVDIFDSDNGSGPVIYHGHTLTSKLSLREVCEAIMSYGFMESDYPIIISAEVHLSVMGQSQMAKIMREVFADRLVTQEGEWEKWKQSPSYTSSPPTTTAEDQSDGVEDPELRAMSSWKIEQLPSPEELKGRILLKTKNLLIANGRKDSGGSVDASAVGGPGTSPPSSWMPPPPVGMVDTTTTSSTSDTDSGAVFSDLESKARSILQRVRSTRAKSSTSASASEGAVSSSPPTGGFLSRRRSSGAKDALASPPASTITPTNSPQKKKDSNKAGKQKKEKVKMSPDLLPLLVYTVGVKCRGINKKEVYAPEEMFSLSENRAEGMLKTGSALDVIKHTRSHLVRIYPKGSRVASSNYEPHRFWVMGAQLVAINWQTFDTGYTINHAMFQRNGRIGYVLKPLALRMPQSQKELLSKKTQHYLDVTVISAQHLPRDKEWKKDSNKKDGKDTGVDPYVEVSLHVPDWNCVVASCTAGSAFPAKSDSLSAPGLPSAPSMSRSASSTGAGGSPTTIRYCTGVVKNNGFNPVWEEKLRIPFECIGEPQGGMKELIFVKFAVKTQSRGDREEDPLAVFCTSLGCLRSGYRHLPLYDAQMSQYLYSTLFVRIGVS
ncbi:hypothetical protein V5O48_013787 [Marasmius crinis-equi]|uniref:Phosphoinositide phospholipase C n=1 Tax=Marasmius crinis-equi TaxID=585013 RepID=A0ABR3EZH1_9AGAR